MFLDDDYTGRSWSFDLQCRPNFRIRPATDPFGFEAGDYNLHRYVFNNPVKYTDPSGELALTIGAVMIGLKIVDYGWTAWDVFNAQKILRDECASDVAKLVAGFEIALAGIFELLDPDEFLPVGVPLDDFVRRRAVREAREAATEEGMEGFVRTARRNLGDDNADKVLREMGLDDWADWARVACSFDAATPVLTLKGLEAISSLEVGDYVLAYNEATDTIGYYPISAIWMHEDPLVLYLVIDGELIETTPEHPFYTMDGEWVAAGELQPGDKIRQADGSYGTVEAVQFVYQLQPMYNLTVANAHTYFVGDGQWLVHNACIDDYLDNLLEGATPGRKTKGNVTQYIQTGGLQEAQTRFGSMDFDRVQEYHSGATKVGFLGDGTVVQFYQSTGRGDPTMRNLPSIKINLPDARRVIAIRYAD